MKAALNIRIDAELKARLNQCAREENRPLSNLVETILKRYLEEREPKPKNPRG